MLLHAFSAVNLLVLSSASYVPLPRATDWAHREFEPAFVLDTTGHFGVANVRAQMHPTRVGQIGSCELMDHAGK